MLISTLSQLLSVACLLFGPGALAVPTNRDSPSSTPYMSCAKWTLPVAVSANNLIFDVPRVNSNIDAAHYAWYQDTWTRANLTARTRSILHVEDTFNINVQLCVPTAATGGKKQILQIATHGFGFDKKFVLIVSPLHRSVMKPLAMIP
jgi:hypothetical protein